MNRWSSIRGVYFLMSIMMFTGILLNNWYVIIFVASMLQIGVWTKFCPSKWLFEKLGFRKIEL